MSRRTNRTRRGGKGGEDDVEVSRGRTVGTRTSATCTPHPFQSHQLYYPQTNQADYHPRARRSRGWKVTNNQADALTKQLRTKSNPHDTGQPLRSQYGRRMTQDRGERATAGARDKVEESEDDQHTPNEEDLPRIAPEPPPSPTRRCQHHLESDRTDHTNAVHRRAHNPGGETKVPRSKLPSVWLERETKLPDDSDSRSRETERTSKRQETLWDPNDPTKPPDEEEGKRGRTC
ncbi:hypothetical protein PAXINDRAFT_7884 [Paxillus involutus ATCC 200175]|nr:hypothetical protein PAXINDRAFT_7884 [Paxillus involutus ATCC 200175]